MRKKVRSTEADIDYMIECMLSEYADYHELLKSHNISIFRQFLYQVLLKLDRYDFVDRQGIHEEILRLGNMLDEDEQVGECRTLDLVSHFADEVLKTMGECRPRKTKKRG